MRIGLRFALPLILSTSLLAQESVRQELIRKQRESGLALTNYSGSLGVVDFATRDYRATVTPNDTRRRGGVVSVDGERVAFELFFYTPGHLDMHLGVEGKDGKGLREYPQVVSPSSVCLSHGQSKVASNAAYKMQRGGELLILDLESGVIEPVAPAAYLTSQCWSPDDRSVVYAAFGAPIRIYDEVEKKSRDLVNGDYPSWSPDGQWIAFRDDGKYFVIRPSGADRHLLFKPKDKPHSGLWWSPDGRFVAYSRRGDSNPCPWWRICIVKFGGPYQLHVRRLSDNSDEWVLDEGDTPVTPHYQWVLPRQAK